MMSLNRLRRHLQEMRTELSVSKNNFTLSKHKALDDQIQLGWTDRISQKDTTGYTPYLTLTGRVPISNYTNGCIKWCDTRIQQILRKYHAVSLENYDNLSRKRKRRSSNDSRIGLYKPDVLLEIEIDHKIRGNKQLVLLVGDDQVVQRDLNGQIRGEERSEILDSSQLVDQEARLERALNQAWIKGLCRTIIYLLSAYEMSGCQIGIVNVQGRFGRIWTTDGRLIYVEGGDTFLSNFPESTVLVRARDFFSAGKVGENRHLLPYDLYDPIKEDLDLVALERLRSFYIGAFYRGLSLPVNLNPLRYNPNDPSSELVSKNGIGEPYEATRSKISNQHKSPGSSSHHEALEDSSLLLSPSSGIIFPAETTPTSTAAVAEWTHVFAETKTVGASKGIGQPDITSLNLEEDKSGSDGSWSETDSEYDAQADNIPIKALIGCLEECGVKLGFVLIQEMDRLSKERIRVP